jgi:hypothetical protein
MVSRPHLQRRMAVSLTLSYLKAARGAGYIPVTDPLVDGTGLIKTYDFELHWTPEGAMAEAGPHSISTRPMTQIQTHG